MNKTEKQIANIIITERWSFVSELANRTGKKFRTVKKHLDSLITRGIVTARTDDFGTMYEINPHHDYVKYGIEPK